MINITELSHQLLKEVKNPNIAIDMTCGNGFDTIFLAKQAKQVFAFDIQEVAIKNTELLVKKHNLTNVKVIKESHDLFDSYINQKIDQIIYNLGYLPKGDKAIKTSASTVVESLKKAMEYLNESGIIVIVVYLHDLEESNAINALVKTLESSFDVMKYEVLNKTNSPYIITIKK